MLGLDPGSIAAAGNFILILCLNRLMSQECFQTIWLDCCTEDDFWTITGRLTQGRYFAQVKVGSLKDC